MSINAAQFPAAVWDGKSTGREDRFTDRSPSPEDWDQIVAEIIAVQESINEPYANQAGGPVVAIDDGVAVAATHSATKLITTRITFVDFEIAMTDAGAAGTHGSAKLVDFPEGLLLFLGVTTALTFLSQTADDSGLLTGAQLVVSLGTVTTATDNGTLTSTEANILASTAATFTLWTSTINTANSAVVFIDGTGGALDCFLNAAAADAQSAGDDVLVVNGTVTLTWAIVGDN